MIKQPNCSIRKCKHFRGVKWLGDTETTEVVYCIAYPEGIPGEIAYGDELHITPHPGDHGIHFETTDK